MRFKSGQESDAGNEVQKLSRRQLVHRRLLRVEMLTQRLMLAADGTLADPTPFPLSSGVQTSDAYLSRGCPEGTIMTPADGCRPDTGAGTPSSDDMTSSSSATMSGTLSSTMSCGDAVDSMGTGSPTWQEWDWLAHVGSFDRVSTGGVCQPTDFPLPTLTPTQWTDPGESGPDDSPSNPSATSQPTSQGPSPTSIPEYPSDPTDGGPTGDGPTGDPTSPDPTSPPDPTSSGLPENDPNPTQPPSPTNWPVPPGPEPVPSPSPSLTPNPSSTPSSSSSSSSCEGDFAIEDIGLYNVDPSKGLREGDSIELHVTLEPYCSSRTPDLTIKIDSDFDGTFSEAEITRHRSEDYMLRHGFTSFYAYAVFKDDGPSPGNATPSDEVLVEVAFGEDQRSYTLEVANVPPAMSNSPVFHAGETEEGMQYYEMTASWRDPSAEEVFLLSVEWPDGVVSEQAFTPDDYRDNLGWYQSVTGKVRRYFEEGESRPGFYPATVTIADDDGGESTVVMQQVELSLNHNDSNENDQDDIFDYGGVSDPDLLRFNFGQFKNELMDEETGYFFLYHPDQTIRLWDSPTKEQRVMGNESIGPYQNGSSGFLDDYAREEGPLPYTLVSYSDQDTLYMEGFELGSSEIEFYWAWDYDKAAESHGGDYVGQPYHPVVYGGKIKATSWGIDYDTDSDNQGVIEFSEWEDELEDNDYAIGKILCLPDGVTACRNRPLALSVLRMPPGLSEANGAVRVRFDELTGKTSSGEIRMTVGGVLLPNAIPTAIEGGGTVITPGHAYDLNQLLYNQNTGQIHVYLQALTASGGNRMKKTIEMLGKPVDRIKATVAVPGRGERTDTIRRMNVEPQSFYEHLNRRDTTGMEDHGTNGQAIRSLLASQLVYDLKGSTDWSLRMLGREEMEFLKIPEDIQEAILDHNVDGLKVALYMDYVSKSFIVSFAGTEKEEADFYTDINNAQGEWTDQYLKAFEIGHYFKFYSATQKYSVLFTGHSLGGGLASAAYVTSGFNADTFNAAGLRREAMYHQDGNGNVLFGADGEATELYPGMKERYLNAAHTVERYYMEHDFLSYFQNHYNTILDDIRVVSNVAVLIGSGPLAHIGKEKLLAWVQDLFHPALGAPYQIDGPYNLDLSGRINWSWLSFVPVEMGLSHKGTVLDYGVFTEEDESLPLDAEDRLRWNILGEFNAL
ncbi:heavy metal translocating P-type ATPase [Rhodopirellula islandica]|uniref:Heavy metal translocating P-type ATPase n=1 Tax=Rhodopirellula islandica TaxID=595434 RepID=A0A0J1BIC9_RHOIS|nr:hypothetical protein [Rhodopirellula islandica]KLU06321.1 heavy metal translocating P-type ATPase [Rhodopirellula islandica]